MADTASKRYRLRHPDRAKMAKLVWESRNPNYYKEYAKRPDVVARTKASKAEYHLRRKYGITVEYRDALLESQHGGCALCGRSIVFGDSSRLRGGAHVDHCHESGRVRGILCGKCNTAIGALGDTVESLERAISYLKGVTV